MEKKKKKKGARRSPNGNEERGRRDGDAGLEQGNINPGGTWCIIPGYWHVAGGLLMQVPSFRSVSHHGRVSGLPPPHPSGIPREVDDEHCFDALFCIIASFSFMPAAFSPLLAGGLDKCVYDISRPL